VNGLGCRHAVSDKKDLKADRQGVRLGDEQQALNALDYRGLKIVVVMVKKSSSYGAPISHL